MNDTWHPYSWTFDRLHPGLRSVMSALHHYAPRNDANEARREAIREHEGSTPDSEAVQDK